MSLARVSGMLAHHGFELAGGVGLVFQPELGLRGSIAFWVATAAADVLLATTDRPGYGRWRAAVAGLALAGVAVHYVVWPWELRLGLPRLTAAEGLRSEQLPMYDTILLGWAAAALTALVTDSGPGERRWAAAGFAAMPLLVGSARHHFRWIGEQARESPAWWNRAVQPDGPGPGRAA